MIELLSFDSVNDMGRNIHDASRPTDFVLSSIEVGGLMFVRLVSSSILFEDRIVFLQTRTSFDAELFF